MSAAIRVVAGQEYKTSIPRYDEAYRPVATVVSLPDIPAFAALSSKTFSTGYTYTSVGQVASVSLPAVSKHLRVLERAGLVRRKRSGRVHSLKLEAKPMQQAQAWIEEYRKFWEGSLDRLADYLEKTAKRTMKTI